MKARPSIAKRQRERAQSDRKKQKKERRVQRKAEKDSESKPDGEGRDADIAWNVPGPQPIPEEFLD